jgi:hypothetical protein
LVTPFLGASYPVLRLLVCINFLNFSASVLHFQHWLRLEPIILHQFILAHLVAVFTITIAISVILLVTGIDHYPTPLFG